MPLVNRQIVLDRIPEGRLTVGHFRSIVGERPRPADGEVLVRNLYVSLDAANRAWMQGATYRSALQPDQVMAAGAIAEVVESRAPSLSPGDVVFGDIGWQEYAARSASELIRMPKLRPLTHLLSVYGVAGLTAYFGLLECGAPKPGDTVVVSAAAGSVGSIVGQIARIMGCCAVGIAGGEEKSRWLTDTLGFHAAVDYRSPDFKRQLREACPSGIDVYFDNVGGDVLEACLFAMNMHGRIVNCGAISQYDGEAPRHGPRGIPGLIVTRRLTLRGFIVSDFDDHRDRALANLTQWVDQGRLKVHEEVLDGLDALPAGLVGLLNGDNRGKRMVRVGVE